MLKKYSSLVFISVIALLVISCERDQKQSTKFNHEILEKYVLQEVDANDIEFTKDEYENYWYSVKDKDLVNQIITLQTNKIKNSLEIADNKLSIVLERNLKEQNIKYALDEFSDNRKLYLFDESQFETARALFHESMNQPESSNPANLE